MRALLVVVAALGTVLAAQHAAPPQQTPTPPPNQQPTFRAGTSTVVVPAVVTDNYGQFVRNLTRADFEIRDNGKVVPITFFDREIQPISAILLLDASASMLTTLKPAIAATSDFIVRMMPGDRLRLGSFSERFRLAPDFLTDRDKLLEYYRNEFNIVVGRRTCLFDAMVQAMATFAGVEGRRVLIVVSDGSDTWSLHTYDDVMAQSARYNVAIYFAQFLSTNYNGHEVEMSRGRDGSGPGRGMRVPRNAYPLMARDTGGGYMQIEENYEIQAPFTEIALDLHSQYVLGFSPDQLDDRMHKLDVKVNRSDLKVRARKSYVASVEGK